MEVLWVLLTIGMLCSRCGAINVKKDNNSIIDDFYLLDKKMQLEICNMIKEFNTSAQLTLQDQVQIKRDFCDHLESLNNPEVEQNLLLMDDERSSTSIISQEPAPGFIFPSSSISKTPTTNSTSSDWAHQSSTELPSALNTNGFIINSNTPMRPNPSDGDLESNSLNLLELSEINPSSDGNGPESTAVESPMAENDDSSHSDNLKYLINNEPSMNNSLQKSSSSNKNESCFGCFNKTSNTPHQSTKHSSIGSAEVVNEESSILTSDLENSSSNYGSKSPMTATKIIFNRPCIKCSFRKNDITQNSSSSLAKVPHPMIPIMDEFSSEFKSNSESVEKNHLIQGEHDLGVNYTIKDENNNVALNENQFWMNDTIKAKETIKGFLQEIHIVPPSIQDTLPKSSTSARYFTKKPSEYNLCFKCLSNLISLNNSNYFEYCGTESSSYNPPQLTLDPSSSSEIESLHNFNYRSSDSSESSDITYNTPSSITNDLLLGSEFPTWRSSITTTYDPLSATKSKTNVCGSPESHSYQSIHSTAYPNSSMRPPCNPIKLIVDPKLPRSSRRRTKILSSLGNLHSYAGFFKTDQLNNVRLFFWFFCNRKWKNIPLIVWLQGEPGQSSLHGLFQEHGPYYLEHTRRGVNMKLRQFSWTKEYSVLYLDHCVGCGFSSANDNAAYTHSYANIAKNIYEALSQFFRIWYEMLPNDLYLAGSYAGAKFIPIIAHTIHTRNEIGFCTRRMNLKGLIIGGPYMDSATMVNYNDFLLANGIIDEVNHKNMIPNQYHAQQLIRAGKYRDAIDFLNFHVYCLISQAGYETYKDVRFLRDNPYDNIRNVVQSLQFKRMICLDKMNFEVKSDVLTEEIMPPIDSLLIPGLLSHYKILYYNGQFDLMAPYMLTSKALSQLQWESIDEFFMAEMVKWCPTKDRNLCPKGYYRNYKNLTHLMVRNVGHSVGRMNSESLLHLLKWFVEGKFQRYGDNDDEWHE